MWIVVVIWLIIVYIKWSKKIAKETEKNHEKLMKDIDETLRELDERIERIEGDWMEIFLEEECCLGSLITDYIDVENLTMSKKQYYESEMIKHDILDVYYEWKKIQEEELEEELEEEEEF